MLSSGMTVSSAKWAAKVSSSSISVRCKAALSGADNPSSRSCSSFHLVRNIAEVRSPSFQSEMTFWSKIRPPYSASASWRLENDSDTRCCRWAMTLSRDFSPKRKRCEVCWWSITYSNRLKIGRKYATPINSFSMTAIFSFCCRIIPTERVTKQTANSTQITINFCE